MRIIKNLLSIAVAASFASLIIGHMEVSVKTQRVNCIVHDPQIITNVKCGVKSFNRTYTEINMRSNIIRVLRKIKLNIQIYKRYQLVYRPFLVNVTEDYCAFFEKNVGGAYMRILWQQYMGYTNLNHSCPYYGEAIIKGLKLTSLKFPPMWPPDDYRMSVTCMEDKHKFITMEFYVETKENDRLNFRNRSQLYL